MFRTLVDCPVLQFKILYVEKLSIPGITADAAVQPKPCIRS